MLKQWIAGAFMAVAMVSCTEDPNSPGVEYMPDMYRPEAYEAYLEKYDLDSVDFYEGYFDRMGLDYDDLDTTKRKEVVAEIDAIYKVFTQNKGTATFKHVEGTMPRGYSEFNVPKGNRDAAKSVKMPLEYTEQNQKEGKVYYEVFCDHCHGEKGDGNGPMVQLGVYPVQPPAYNGGNSANLTPGEIYHTIYYGKGVMGSHAAQIAEDKRWKIVMYVQKLQGKTLEELQGNKTMEVVADTVAMDTTAVDTTK